MDDRRFFFVLALPRSRTAWCAVALSLCAGAWCSHEAALGHETFEAYAAELRGRDAAVVGDVVGSPVYVERLRAEFPEARWIIIERPPEECFASLQRVANGWDAPKWAALVHEFTLASATLLLSGKAVSVEASELDDGMTLAGLCRFIGAPFNAARAREAMRLRVTQLVDTTAPVPFIPRPVEMDGATLSVARLGELGFDLGGLTVRRFDAAHDFPTVAGWWQARTGVPLGLAALPPLGVVIEDATGPAGALWCYESFGVGVAHLTFPITRPGLALSRASAVMAFAVAAVVQVAGKSVEPEGHFHTFHAATYPAIARLLKRLGFRESRRDKVSLFFTHGLS